MFLFVCIVSNIVIAHVSLVVMVKVCSLTSPLPEVIWRNGSVHNVAKVVQQLSACTLYSYVVC